MKQSQIEVYAKRKQLLATWLVLKAGGVSRKDAAARLGVNDLMLWRLENGKTPVEPKYNRCGRKPKLRFTSVESATVAAHNLNTNFSATAGSAPEAVKRAMKNGEIGDSLHRHLRERENQGLPMLTPFMREQVKVGETAVAAYRRPREAWLNYVSSPGSLMLTNDPLQPSPDAGASPSPTPVGEGQERYWRPGEAWTIDDGTINFICVVPGLEKPGDKCWEKFGVMVGRFQFIVLADHRSYFIPGFSYTARPRGSYRAEDLTSCVDIAGREHGLPRNMFMERGVSASRLVHETFERAGIKIIHVKSPHQKIVELLFNKLWTKLSGMPGQVGRFAGDEEAAVKLLQSCRTGATDPRKVFATLGTVIASLREAIEEHNSGWINYSRYGRWIPRDWWQREARLQLQAYDEKCSWLFSPVITQPLTVKGFNVATTVRLMDGLSQKFTFSADWLHEQHGRLVKLFFNPFVDAPAKVVSCDEGGTVLGDAEMIDRQARFNLRHLGYGEFPDIGLAAARSAAQSLRRHVQAIRADGKPGVVAHETRTFNAERSTLNAEVNGRTAEAPKGRGMFAPRSPEQISRQKTNLSRQAELSKRLREMAEV